jgi:hypothetical protein
MKMFASIAASLVMIFMGLAPVAYPILQIIALRKSTGRLRFVAGVPIFVMVPVIWVTIQAFRADSNLWPLFLIFASPVACVWSIVCLAIATRRNGSVAKANLS